MLYEEAKEEISFKDEQKIKTKNMLIRKEKPIINIILSLILL